MPEQDTVAQPTPFPTNQETVGHDKDDRPRIRVSSYGSNRGVRDIKFDGLDSKELELMQGAAHGHQWVTVSPHGRLRAIPTYKELPPPVEDQMMMPFWRPAIPDVETQLEMFDFGPKDVGLIPSIIIQHLCGYQYSHENYARQARTLQHFGFECLRSRRLPSGQFHEMWLLLSLYSAKGGLKEAIDTVSSRRNKANHDHTRLKAAIDFLCRNVRFGTLDVTKQCAAMTVD